MSWILIASVLVAGGGEIEWQKGNLPRAFETARETGEPLMVYFRADWDRFSGQLDDGAFSDKEVVVLSGKFIRVLVDCSKKPVYREMARVHQLEGIPSLYFFDAAGRKIGSVVGYVPGTDAYLDAMTEALAKRSPQDGEERMKRLLKRVDEALENSLRKLRGEIRDLVRSALRRANSEEDPLDAGVDAFADRIVEDGKMNSRLRAFLKTKKGKKFIRGQMNMLGVDDLDDAVEHYFRRNEDGTYSVRPDFEPQLRDFLEQAWPEKKKGVRLGFSGGGLPEGWHAERELDPGTGLLISGVAPGGPAEKAGIKTGDILVFLGGRKVGPGTIREVLGTLSPGKEIAVVVLREGKRVRLSLVPGEKE